VALELGRLPEFAGRLEMRGLVKRPPLFDEAQRAARKALKAMKLPPHIPLHGLLTLVYLYLLQGKEKELPEYVKKYHTWMARTDFATMYRTLLPVDERSRFRPDLVLESAPKRVRKPDAHVYPQGYPLENKKIAHGPTRLEWLTSIIKPMRKSDKDELSPPPGIHESNSMGRLGTEPVGPRRTAGVILELRNLPGRQPIEKWDGLALQIFDTLKEFNASPGLLVAEPPARQSSGSRGILVDPIDRPSRLLAEKPDLVRGLDTLDLPPGLLPLPIGSLVLDQHQMFLLDSLRIENQLRDLLGPQPVPLYSVSKSGLF
jgi:hypothetical protein